MMSYFSRRTIFRLFALGLTFLAVSEAIAQTQAGRGTTTRPTTPTAGRGGTTGGGGGGGSSSGGNRTYTNSTMVGEALVTSDLDTRRLIIVTDDETNENIRTIVAGLDKPKPQVLINVVFVQVTHDNGLDLGAEVSIAGSIPVDRETKGRAPDVTSTRFGLADAFRDTTQAGAFYRVLGQDVTATLRALSAVSKTEILSRPSILTRNNQQATIMVGQSIPLISSSRVSDVNNSTLNTVTYQDVGIILRVTPFITSQGLVEMIVSPEISALSATTVAIGNGVNSPVIDRRQADTVVVTASDKTVVIGGLISTQTTDKVSKVPILGDIPLLGYAFKRKTKSDVKTELLIFLTPHVVPTVDDMDRVSNEERRKMELAPKAFPKEDMEKYIGKP
ncbi:MAG: hypothetical protein EXS37_05395 [Opitutus sp.]|nr:hypothetical protein [Opitutus sp.]